jgi:hypothetical protein
MLFAQKNYLHYLERDYFENGQEEFEMGLPNIEGGTGNPFGGWVGFFPPSSCMPFSPKVITSCTSHGAASDVIFRAAKISLIAVLNPKSDELDGPSSSFFLDFTGHGAAETGVAGIVGQFPRFFILVLSGTGNTHGSHSSPNSAFGVGV